jgi:hypothetical protein
MKSTKTKTITAPWLDELRLAAEIKPVPDGWLSATQIVKQEQLPENKTREALRQIDDPDLVVVARCSGGRPVPHYNWAAIKEML